MKHSGQAAGYIMQSRHIVVHLAAFRPQGQGSWHRGLSSCSNSEVPISGMISINS